MTLPLRREHGWIESTVRDLGARNEIQVRVDYQEGGPAKICRSRAPHVVTTPTSRNAAPA